MLEKQKPLAKVNGQAIVVIENGTQKVPIRPICDALGISFQGQIEKLKEDDFLKSTLSLSLTVGSDGKEREMQCIPFKFVFGWLFTINPKNVKPEAQEAVLKYRMQCYEILYRHFTDPYDFLLEKQTKLDIKLAELDWLQKKALATKADVQSCKAEIEKIRSVTLEQWQAEQSHSQLEIPYETEPKEITE